MPRDFQTERSCAPHRHGAPVLPVSSAPPQVDFRKRGPFFTLADWDAVFPGLSTKRRGDVEAARGHMRWASLSLRALKYKTFPGNGFQERASRVEPSRAFRSSDCAPVALLPPARKCGCFGKNAKTTGLNFLMLLVIDQRWVWTFGCVGCPLQVRMIIVGHRFPRVHPTK